MTEFAKRFTLAEVWGKEYANLELKPVLESAKAMGYKESDTLYDVLFANKNANKFCIALSASNRTTKGLLLTMFIFKKYIFSFL